MKSKLSIIYLLVGIFLFSLITSSPIYSHSGRTDSSGGHTNRKTGEYHYHNRPSKKTTTPTYKEHKSSVSQYQINNKELVYHGNRKSKKLHKSSCRYFNCKNCTAVFSSKANAIKAGYVPCKVCKP